MDALELAREAMDRGAKGTLPEHLSDFFFVQAQAYAAIAQAEQLQRIATATERRNELLAEFNEQSKTDAATHTEKMAESVSTFLDAHFDKDE